MRSRWITSSLARAGPSCWDIRERTQDVRVFPARSPENGQRIVAALRNIWFEFNSTLEQEILAGKDFVQLKSGPFDVDLVFAPDGIGSFDEAKARGWTEGIFHVANLRDIIASKRASGRQKDEIELPLLENFRMEFEKRHAPSLHSAAEIAAQKSRDNELSRGAGVTTSTSPLESASRRSRRVQAAPH
jgi:hypothetical protein